MSTPYDAEMIADFFEHLLCEVRLAEIEGSGGKPDLELTKRLAVFIRKRRAARLIADRVLTPGPHDSDEDCRQAARILSKKRSMLRRRQALAIEYLRPLVEEALRLAVRPLDEDAPVRTIECGEVLRRSRSPDAGWEGY